MDRIHHVMVQCVPCDIYGVFERETWGEFRLHATKTMLVLDQVYYLHSKGAEWCEGRCYDVNSNMSGRSVEVEEHTTDS